MPTGRLPAPPSFPNPYFDRLFFLYISKLNKTILSSRLRPWSSTRTEELGQRSTTSRSKALQRGGNGAANVSEPELNTLTHGDAPQAHTTIPEGREGEGEPGLSTHLDCFHRSGTSHFTHFYQSKGILQSKNKTTSFFQKHLPRSFAPLKRIQKT